MGPLGVKRERYLCAALLLQPKIYLTLIGQVAEIKAIIDSARKEFTVEDNLQTITHTLSDLAFKYKINSNNIRVITNDAQVRDNFCW